MWRKLLWATTGVLSLFVLLLAGTLVSIRSGLQRFSDDAVSRFPGDRVDALMQVVDCETCALEDRNHAVWALGQMVEEKAIKVLRKHFDGQPCAHTKRLCQYELRKAIRMIDGANNRTDPAWRVVAEWHQPWR